MKKLFRLSVITLASLLLPLSGCGDNGGSVEKVCEYHIDLDGDGLCENCGKPVPSTKKDFTGITFNNQSFEYDTNKHSIYCANVPSFAQVNYEGNDKSEIGSYTVVATISANDYNTLVLVATLTITEPAVPKKEFEGLIFEDARFPYDEQTHRIEISNLPSFARASYSGNGKSAVGVYTVTATVRADGYYDKVLTAKMDIYAEKMTGLVFKDEVIPYDDEYHSIYVEGAPEGAKITYKNNNQCDVGTYTVTATVKCVGYYTETLTAKMKIANLLPKVELEDRTLFYTGKAQMILHELPELPRFTEVKYIVDGKEYEDPNDFRVTTLGKHTVGITLTNTKYKYEPATVTATINVVNQNVGGVDSTKTPLNITNDLKYDDLRSAILKGNFTVKTEIYDDHSIDGKVISHVLSATIMTYVANNEAFSYRFEEYPESPTSFIYHESYIDHYKIVGDDVLHAYFEDGLINSTTKFPASAYQENIPGQLGLVAMSLTKKSASGGFENISQGGYHTNYGKYSIDATNNVFKLESRTMYPEHDAHDEVTEYSIYNIGNTKIDIIDAFSVNKIDAKEFTRQSYYINGFEYSIYTKDDGSEYAGVDVDFDATNLAYLEKGTYTILPVFDGRPVLTITEDYYHNKYDLDLAGYTFKVHFLSNGYYKGEYEDFGRIGGYSALDNLDNATVLYYDDWH